MACGRAFSYFCWWLVFYVIDFMQIAIDSIFHIILSALNIPEEELVTQPNTNFLRSTPLHYRYRLPTILLNSPNPKVAKTFHGHLLDCYHTLPSTKRIAEACPYVIANKVFSWAKHRRSYIDHLRSFGFQSNQRLLASQSKK